MDIKIQRKNGMDKEKKYFFSIFQKIFFRFFKRNLLVKLLKIFFGSKEFFEF